MQEETQPMAAETHEPMPRDDASTNVSEEQGVSQPGVPSPSTPPDAPKPRSTRMLIYIIGSIVLLIGIGVGLFVTQGTPSNPSATLPPSEEPVATPTPIRTPSAIATMSAFFEAQNAVSTVSGMLGNVQTNDPSLSPPSLDLELGFSN